MDTRPAAGALALRAWALRVLSAGSAAAGPAPLVGGEGWARFLAAERVALPLRSRLDAAALEGLGEVGRAALEARATVEMQRALSARGQLRTLGAVAKAGGWPALVLKSGVEAAAGAAPVDLADVDVLLMPEDARPFAAALDARGYRAPYADPAPDVLGAHELAPRRPAGGIQVEVHYRVDHLGEGVDLWAGALPSGVPGLLRPAPALHLWHVLTHAVVHHPERRGLLREVLQVGAALSASSAEERAWVEARAAAHPAAPVMRALLSMADSVRRGEAPPDPFRTTAAAAYLLLGAGRRVSLDGRFGIVLATATHALAAPEGGYARLWHGDRASALVPAGEHSGQWLDRRAPLLGRAVRTAIRSATLAAATVPALLLARSARRLASSSSDAASGP